MKTIHAYAKINLGLRILSRRPDGYHSIESLFLLINWYDRLVFEPAAQFRFQCTDSRLPVDEQNLVVKAVRRVESILGFPFPFSITLDKQIPFGAGLGGGSSDAAAVLRFAKNQWPGLLPGNTVEGIASFLGSDINFFLNPGTQLATDRGILLTPVPFTIPAWIVIGYPPVEVPTGWAYQQVKPADYQLPGLDQLALRNPALEDYQSVFINDFDEPISRLKPEISRLKNQLREAGATYVSLSGSGSACFGLFHEKSQAESAATSLSEEFQVRLTPPGFKPDPEFW